MRRAILGTVGIVCGGVALAFGLQGAMPGVSAAEKDKNKDAKAAPAAVAQAKPEQEKIVYTFADDAKMAEFTTLWQQRQATIVRMSVLKSYWDEEQSALVRLNQQFSTDYQLDVTKNYTLDDQRRVLIEREAALPPQLAPAPANVIQSTP